MLKMKDKILNYLKENNYLNERTLLTSIVGSRMWGMEHEGSDWDIFIVVNEPLEDMLSINYHSINKEFKYVLDGVELDIKIKEIKDVLKQLYKNNPNFIFGVLSDNVIYESNVGLMRELRSLTYRNINYQIFPPLKGMVNHNYKKYFINKVHDKSGKKEMVIRKIAWLYNALVNIPERNQSMFYSRLVSLIPPDYEYLRCCGNGIEKLDLKDIVNYINNLEIPDECKFDNDIGDFNQYSYKLKI